MENEKIAKQQKMNKRYIWYFFLSNGWQIILAGILVLIFFGLLSDSVYLSLLFVSLFGIVVVALLIDLLWAYLVYHFYRFEFREHEFRRENGVIHKRYVSIPYERIQNINIERSFFDRIFGLSKLQIETAGGAADTAEGRLPGLSPEEAERVRDELMERARSTFAHDPSSESGGV